MNDVQRSRVRLLDCGPEEPFSHRMYIKMYDLGRTKMAQGVLFLCGLLRTQACLRTRVSERNVIVREC